jgi:DNA repair exonuclease SbcCD nuclease subunit
MQILHTADAHLDRAFSGAGMTSSMAAARRQELRDAFRRFVDLALELRVDAVTIGGDLYEHERSTLDTGNFLRQQFARLGEVPVIIATGNHDPYVPDSLYRRVDWPANVHVFGEPRFKPFQVLAATSALAREGRERPAQVTVWAAGHDGPDLRQNLIDGFGVPREGTHLLLFHGSDLNAVPEGKRAHCGFRPADVGRTGAAFALLGHYHGARLSDRFAYPGSPEALDFSEEGPHFVLRLDVGADGVRPELIPFGEVRYATQRLDVSAAQTSDDLRTGIAAFGDREAIVRIVLEGQLQPDVDLDVRALYNACAERFRFLDLVDRTEPAYAFDELAQESTTKGAFVRLMRSRIEALAGEQRETAELALRLGLQAFERREVVAP